jgi:hypothetical protein
VKGSWRMAQVAHTSASHHGITVPYMILASVRATSHVDINIDFKRGVGSGQVWRVAGGWLRWRTHQHYITLTVLVIKTHYLTLQVWRVGGGWLRWRTHQHYITLTLLNITSHFRCGGQLADGSGGAHINTTLH